MTQVQVRGLVKTFGSSIAIDDLDLTVEEGEFVTILGPSGCGKTTTLRCVAGLEVPDQGSVVIGGRIASDPARGSFIQPDKRDIGMVFQSYALWPHMTVAQNVAYPLKMARTPKANVRRRVAEVLEMVGLAHLASRPATGLSGGQQQRVALARALVKEPRLMLYDEPLSNLDARLRATMRAELRAIHARTGTTSICVTHDQVEALTLSDRVVVMRAGRIEQEGAPERIFSSPANHFVAHFVGFDVFLPGAVSESHDRDCMVMLEGSNQPVRCITDERFPVNTKVEIATRSTAIRIRPIGAGQSTGSLKGVITDRAFMGDAIQFALDLDGHGLIALVPTDQIPEGGEHLRPGSPVEIEIGVSSARVFAHADSRRAGAEGIEPIPTTQDSEG